MKPMQEAMQRHDGPVDICIVGCGQAGSVLAKQLAAGGLSVVVLEAGRWLDTKEDFLNDELAMLGPLDWDDTRLSDGSDPLPLGRVNTGRAVGGSTVHFTAVKLRLHPEDFELHSRYGIGVDWPFGYDELAPYYRQAEEFVGVSGPRDFPWGGHTEPYPQGELPLQAADELFARGMDKLGIRWRMTPHAILTGAKDGRSPCMFYGFCVSGCKSDAKGSALVTWVPAAVKAGAEIREECFATRVVMGNDGRAAGVAYLHDGVEYFQQAQTVMLSCYSVETPRLLLNSATAQYPDGLSNSSGLVGRNLMVHPASEVVALFPDPVDHFISPPVGILTQDFYEQGAPGNPRGYTINRYAHFPIDFMLTLAAEHKNLWGRRMHEVMDQYAHWAVICAMVEQLPSPENRVTLAEETDQHGIPVAHVTMSYGAEEKQLVEASMKKLEEICAAADADEMLTAKYADHVLGTCRMGTDAASSVVNADCRSHDIPNMYICDGSIFPTCGAVNPSLTIEAIALRTAEKMLANP
jgi:choline dehydrogenase-like flavoprotein